MKYYAAQNVGELVAGVRFEKYEIVGGTAFGVYKTDDDAQIAKFDPLIGRSSLIEIDEAEYDRCLKKKRPGFDDLRSWSPQQAPQTTSPGVAIKGQGAVVVEHTQPQPNAPVGIIQPSQIESIDDALKVAPVEQPPVAQPEVIQPTRRRGNR